MEETGTHQTDPQADRPAATDQTEPNAPLTALIGIGAAVSLFVIVVLLQALFYHSEAEETARKVIAATPEELAQLRAQQEEQLNSYRWVDEKKQIAAIPIDRAIKLIAGEAAARH